MHKKGRKRFTLIHLTIIICIMGLLGTVVIHRLVASKLKGLDAELQFNLTIQKLEEMQRSGKALP